MREIGKAPRVHARSAQRACVYAFTRLPRGGRARCANCASYITSQTEQGTQARDIRGKVKKDAPALVTSRALNVTMTDLRELS